MVARVLPIALLAALLAGCAVAPPAPDEVPSWDQVLAAPPDEAWSWTLRLPAADIPRRQLELIERWVGQQRWAPVALRLAEVDAAGLDPAHRARLQLVRVQLLLRDGEELAALTALSGLTEDDAALLLRARIYEQLNDPENALRTRLRYAARPGAEAAREAHYRQAWDALRAMSRQRLESWRDRTGDATWRGWLELALLTRADGRLGASPLDALAEWRRRHDGHPARRWLPAIAEALRELYPGLSRLAALIPVSGDFAPVGKAIRAGLEAGMRRHDGAPPELRIYDTGDPTQTPAELYRQAVEEGAERVIGPFDKNAVMRLARAAQLPVDTLSLNYLETRAPPPGNLYQFGLLPEDEAVQVAARALQEGRRDAVVFAPANPWGQRLYQAFARRFEAGGGTVRGHGSYFANAADHAAKIKDILKLSDGERRQQALEEALGREVVSQPSRRQDIDMVFLASSPRNARLFKPQLDFYYAGDLPLYATSHIYAGAPSPLQDQDLDGTLFCDIPLILDERLQEQLGRAPAARELPRFAALGADAYLLAMNLDYLQRYPGASLAGWTGGLTLRDGRRVFRTLSWARFHGGRVQPVPELRLGAIAPRYRTQD